MICPNCGSSQTKVVDSRERDGYRYRRYHCRECFERFTTTEMTYQPKKGTKPKLTALDATASAVDFGTLCICALRYCYGRQTYMPDLVRGIVRPWLRLFSDNDINVMLEDFAFYERMSMLGHETIDKPGWEKWKQELQNEKERRQINADDQ